MIGEGESKQYNMGGEDKSKRYNMGERVCEKNFF